MGLQWQFKNYDRTKKREKLSLKIFIGNTIAKNV